MLTPDEDVRRESAIRADECETLAETLDRACYITEASHVAELIRRRAERHRLNAEDDRGDNR